MKRNGLEVIFQLLHNFLVLSPTYKLAIHPQPLSQNTLGQKINC